MSAADATLIAAHLAQVDWGRVFTLDTRRYAPDYPPMAERMSWPAFTDAVPVLFRRDSLGGEGLEAVIVPKSLTWSDRDVNVYIGSATGPAVRSFLDLGERAFAAVFSWHVALARELSAELGCDVYVTHGFNPRDSSPDAHSVTAKFHTHVHVPGLAGRRPAMPSALSHFDRLALIEPYSVVAWDLLTRLLAERGAASRWRAAAGHGYLTLFAPLERSALDDDLRTVARLLAEVHRTYLGLVEVFTAQETERATGHDRYMPRPRAERHRRLAAFEDAGAGWLSEESVAVLRYLARNLADAEPRDSPGSRRIATAGQAWIAKGFSGALNLVVPADGGTLRFDLAPRVISTSGATKVISPDPTIIRKDQGWASSVERRRMAEFQEAVVAAATRSHPVPAQQRSLPSTSSSPVPPGSSA